MRCLSCGFDGPEGARFCAQCGEPLALSCPACGATASPEHKFCAACGSSLQAASASGASPPAAGASSSAAAPAAVPARPSAGERRQVTVLFVDLVGYTRLVSELGAEEVHDLVSRFFARADRIVEAYGGSVDKHIGDCVMAVFGAPLAHDNDPERAVRAALAIRDGLPELGREIGREIGVHVGIASGQVVAGGAGSDAHREYTVTGDSVNLAARLTDRAGSNEILISDAVRRAVAGRLRLRAARRPRGQGPGGAGRGLAPDRHRPRSGRRPPAPSSAGARSSPSSGGCSRPVATAVPGTRSTCAAAPASARPG